MSGEAVKLHSKLVGQEVGKGHFYQCHVFHNHGYLGILLAAGCKEVLHLIPLLVGVQALVVQLVWEALYCHLHLRDFGVVEGLCVPLKGLYRVLEHAFLLQADTLRLMFLRVLLLLRLILRCQSMQSYSIASRPTYSLWINHASSGWVTISYSSLTFSMV